jgi:transposase
MARIEIMSGTERRRRCSDEAKLRILAEADEPGARIGDVARRHDIHPGQIRLWRQSFSYADRPTVFLPVEITEEVGVSQPSTAATEPAIVEILHRNGREGGAGLGRDLRLPRKAR